MVRNDFREVAGLGTILNASISTGWCCNNIHRIASIVHSHHRVLSMPLGTVVSGISPALRTRRRAPKIIAGGGGALRDLAVEKCRRHLAPRRVDCLLAGIFTKRAAADASMCDSDFARLFLPVRAAPRDRRVHVLCRRCSSSVRVGQSASFGSLRCPSSIRMSGESS
jgi:hypothetical protein